MEVPLKVRVISILGMILSVIGVIFGLLMIFGLGSSFISVPEIGADISGGLVIVSGVITILMSLVTFFISFNLGKLKNWARIGMIILAVLTVLSSFQNLFGKTFLMGLIQLAVGGYVIWCLGFDEEVKKVF